MSTLFSLAYWAFAAISSFFLFQGALLIWLATRPFDATQATLHRYTCCWAQLYLRCLGCRVEVQGLEKLDRHAAYVLVANHQSAADILALCALQLPFKWISKKQNFYIPFVGWNMWLNDYIAVETGNKESIRNTMAQCKSWLTRGVSVLWFPEGQRSFTGVLLPFRPGAFRLAVDCQCPVAPIVVEGTRVVFSGWRVSFKPGRILVRVLDPITLAEADNDADVLRELTWQRINTAHKNLREEIGMTRNR